MGSAPQLVSSALSASASSLSSVVIGEVKLCSSFRDDLESLKQVKILLQCRVKNAEDQFLEYQLSCLDQADKNGLFASTSEAIRALKSLIYDIEDINSEYINSKEKLRNKTCLQKVFLFECFAFII